MNVANTQTRGLTSDAVTAWKYGLIACGIALLCVFVAFWSTYVAIVAIWLRSETFAHGFVILPISAFLIWRKRDVLRQLSPQPAPIALLLVFAAGLVWLLATEAEVAEAEQIAAVAMIPIMVWVCLGTAVARAIAFPLLYLLFAAPFGDFLTQHLQDVTARISVWALQVTGIPVYLEGRFIFIPTGSFQVAQACSGIRYLIASLALGTLYAYLTYNNYWRRFIFIIISAIVPIIANGIRAYGIIMLAHLSGYKLAVGVDHIIYGWIFFGVVVFTLFWIGSLFREEEEENDISLTSGSQKLSLPVQLHQFAMWSVIAIFVAISPSVLAQWLDAKQNAIPALSVELPHGRNGWEGPILAKSAWYPKFSGAKELKASYRKGGKQVDVYLAYYTKQVQGSELVGWNNTVYDSKRSKRLDSGETLLDLNGNKKWPVRYMQTTSIEGGRLILYWYDVGGHSTANRLKAKLYELKRRLIVSKKGSAAFVISAPYELTKKEAVNIITNFLDDMLQPLRETVS